MVKIICKTCNKEFKTIPARAKTAKFCSRLCKNESRKGKPPWNKGKTLHYTVWNKGKHPEYMQGKNHHNWNNGICQHFEGYVLSFQPAHPHAINERYILKHRLVMEKHIGRFLTPEEVVHHIDKNPKNNNIDNLVLFKNVGEHTKYHAKLRAQA